jgi:hypothetical protein
MKRISYLLIFLWLFHLTTPVYASRYALVMNKRAIVYADQDLDSPIGYLPAGKKIMIGETERKRGSIISIVVAERIAWIRLADISIERDSYSTFDKKKSSRFTISEEEFRNINEKAASSFSNNLYLYLSYGVFNLDQDFEQFTTDLGSEEPVLYSNNFSIEVVHRTPFKRTFWSVGLSYYVQSSQESEWNSLFGQVSYYWSLVKSRVFTVDLYGGLLLTGDFQLQTNNLTTGLTTNDSGYGYGYKVGAQIKLFPYADMGFVGGISNQYIKINELGVITSAVTPDTELEKLSGLNIYFGVTWLL